jgi:carboxylesterase type B
MVADIEKAATRTRILMGQLWHRRVGHERATSLTVKGVIVVVPNFRLGLLGFLAHPELSKESPSGSSGNQGILDCIQALQWIQTNISSFGGDPKRVTIGGQSSGATMTGKSHRSKHVV